MKKKSYLNYLLALFVCSVLLLLPQISASASSDTDTQRVWDYAGAFSSTELSSLEKKAEDYCNKKDYHLLILTTNTLSDGYEYESSYSSEQDCDSYTEAFYNSLQSEYGNTYKNSVILTLDLSNRYALVTSWGNLKKGPMDATRCTQVYEAILDELSDDQWFEASEKYYTTTNRFLQIRSGINPNNIFLKTWFQLILAVIISAIIIIINIIHAGGKMTVSNRTYLDNERSKLVGKHDHYIRTSVRKTKRESSHSSSSGHGGGGSHSSGGGHF